MNLQKGRSNKKRKKLPKGVFFYQKSESKVHRLMDLGIHRELRSLDLSYRLNPGFFGRFPGSGYSRFQAKNNPKKSHCFIAVFVKFAFSYTLKCFGTPFLAWMESANSAGQMPTIKFRRPSIYVVV